VSDWVTYRDQADRHRGLSAALRDVLRTSPGLTANELAQRVGFTRRSVWRQLLRWYRAGGVVRTVDFRHSIGRPPYRWSATPHLEQIRSGGTKAHPPVPLDLDDEDINWTPKPYVHPIRARALGMAA